VDELVCLASGRCDVFFGRCLYNIENPFVYLDSVFAKVFVSGSLDGIGAGGCAGDCRGKYCFDRIDLEICISVKKIDIL